MEKHRKEKITDSSVIKQSSPGETPCLTNSRAAYPADTPPPNIAYKNALPIFLFFTNLIIEKSNQKQKSSTRTLNLQHQILQINSSLHYFLSFYFNEENNSNNNKKTPKSEEGNQVIPPFVASEIFWEGTVPFIFKISNFFLITIIPFLNSFTSLSYPFIKIICGYPWREIL